MYFYMQISTSIWSDLPLSSARLPAREARPVTTRIPIPEAQITSRDFSHSFCLRRQIHLRPSLHGAFGTIDVLDNRPSRLGAQTIITLGTFSQTMQAILHYPFHAIPDLIRAQPHAARTGTMNGSNV